MARLGLALALALGAARPALAHPDILMECHLLFNFENGRITGLGESWAFDEAFSAQLLADYDTDGDGQFGEAESRAIRDETFANLEGGDYFTRLTLDDRPLPVPEPFGFKAGAQAGIVTFSFGLRLAEPVDPRLARLGVEIRDEAYAVGASMAPRDPIYLRGAPAGLCRPVLRPRRDDAYFDGLVVPQEASADCS